MITLIANSGIQFHSFDLIVNANEGMPNRKVGFYEYLNNDLELSLEYAYFFPEEDLWIRKADLLSEGYIDENGTVINVINFHTLLPLNPEECYRISDLKDCFDSYNNTWLPIPYFNQEGLGNVRFGPTAWSRLIFKKLSEVGAVTTYKVTLAFDTKVVDDYDNYFVPNYDAINSDNNSFALCNKEDLTLNFLSGNFDGSWITNYLEERYIGQIGANSFKYAAKYIFLVRYLATKIEFPYIKIYSDRNVTPIDVDLVLDIGNANTFGLLFENPDTGLPFSFEKVKKLKLTNLTDPTYSYDDPFDMRLTFAKASFGGIQIPKYQGSFSWPSFVRVGAEAVELITKSNSHSEKLSHHSSPKRYLWDNQRPNTSWDFVNGNPVYIEGLSEFFDENGSLLADNNRNLGVLRPYYAKKSLLTFVYIEIFLHALSQINSFEFRNYHLERHRPRRIKRVVITCPTSIIQEEQITLRKCAAEAAKIITSIYKKEGINFEIVPSVNDLSRRQNEAEDREDWIYDEATCCQVVFVYAEIKERYLNNANLFFELYGKFTKNQDNKSERSVTIGTVDIGGGTSDLMICSYQNEGQPDVLLKPNPLYWESFSLAGDDLLKEIVRQIVLEGSVQNSNFEGCTGVIENYARACGCKNVVGKMNDFFGVDVARMDGDHNTIHRRNFIVQIAKPIAERYLAHAGSNEEDRMISFDELFPDLKPNEALLKRFNDFFSDNGAAKFKFQDIKWKLSRERVFEIIQSTYDELFKQISILVSSYGCDFLLLTGQITKISKIKDIFLKYYSVHPERIISLNNYRVGKWYPFANDRGYFEEPKTIVAVGALIAMMSGKYDKLSGFRINSTLLKTKLNSRATYIGPLNRETHDMDQFFFNQTLHRANIKLSSIPLKLGYKQLENSNYPGKPIYQITFNYDEIKAFIMNNNHRGAVSDIELKDLIERQERSLKNRMPFYITISRNFNESKEHIEIEEILDFQRDEIPKKWLRMSYMTLPEPKGYWLDTGEFILNIQN
jgi:hypothetical protein